MVDVTVIVSVSVRVAVVSTVEIAVVREVASYKKEFSR